MPLIDVEREGPIARVWLARPEAHNALSQELAAELADVFGARGGDDGVRVVVLGGRGRSFCAGADIGAMKASASATFDQNLAEAERLGAGFAALADFPKPLVARVHGGVYGGGVGMVCCADIAVASDDARFGLTEVRLGILPGLISPYVIRRLGDRRARELMLTGERFGAERALAVGLVDYVVPMERLDAQVAERVQQLLAGAPGAQRRVKGLLARWGEVGWEEYRATLPRTLAEVRSGDEAKDGLAAFFDKRKPGWVAGD
jgi:methylglutaconyl-CoA hydratase